MLTNTKLSVPKNAKEALHNILVFNARDWSTNIADAWLWGIIVGWDNASLKELKEKHKWSDSSVKQLKEFNKQFKRMK